LSWHSAWRLLDSLEQAVYDIDSETDLESRELARATLATELQHLAAWLRQYSGYDCEEQLAGIENRLYQGT
jgi:hypothetical protein